MKTIPSLIIIMMVSIFLQHSALADDVDLKMITSLAALRSYAEEAVVRGSTWVSGSIVAPMYGEKVTYMETDLPDGQSGTVRVLGELSNKSFWFAVADTKQPLWLGGQLSNQKGYVLFSGQKQLALKQEYGQWTVPYWDTFLKYKLAPVVPITIPGVTSARIGIKDASGNVIVDQYLQVQDGQVFWPTNFTERSGSLVLNIDDGAGNAVESVYDLSTSKKLPIYSVWLSSNGSVEGIVKPYYSYTDFRYWMMMKDDVMVLNYEKSQTVTFGRFYQWENFDTLPVAILIRKKGEPWTRIANGVEEFSLQLEAGEYHVIVEWPVNTDRPIDYWPYYGGGKG